MKIFTMYLPQFHRVKENDEWWGEGFTEWTAVRKAEKLMPGHYQPRVPLNENYYDLMNKGTMEWQADLMKSYGIDGQCFYHYWFKDGRQILEKPAENLLRWTDIDMPFCFCWANASWARTWSKLRTKNSWAVNFEKEDNKNGSGILLDQKYGGEEQWRQHFDYLLPFFQDARYIKIEGKPVFMIYDAVLIPCFNEMINKWQQWAVEKGFPGVYIIGKNVSQGMEELVEKIYYLEPEGAFHALREKIEGKKEFGAYDYDDMWEKILTFSKKGEKAVYGGFVGYDNTPRQGKIGKIVENNTPQKFERYLSELIAKNIAYGNDMIFINAWNEWGEGMYLEPDEKHGYAYLEAVRGARKKYNEYLEKYQRTAYVKDDSALQQELQTLTVRSERFESYWRLFERWLTLKEEKVSIEKYFTDRKIETIAVYGVKMAGEHLFREMENSTVKIAYAIDRKAYAVTAETDVRVYMPDEELPPVDAVVVTPVYDFDNIKRMLKEKHCSRIISLAEVLEEI